MNGYEKAQVSASMLAAGVTALVPQPPSPDRDLVVPDADQRRALWIPWAWPGGILVGGEITGTWRRADAVVTVPAWRP
jgi:hypothetical protein